MTRDGEAIQGGGGGGNAAGGEPMSELDRATAARLARLRSMPVDVTSLRRRLEAELPPRPRSIRMVGGWRSFRGAITWGRAVAAALVVGAVLAGALLMASGRPAMAAADELARFHRSLVAGQVPGVVKAASVEEANAVLAGMGGAEGLARLPEMPAGHEMACCLKEVGSKRVACVLLRRGGEGGVPVTMMVADAGEVRLREERGGQAVTRGGTTYRVHGAGELTMVSGLRSGRWVCVIGAMPADELIAVVESMRF